MVSKRMSGAGVRIVLAILVVGSVGGIALSQAKGSPAAGSALVVETTHASSMEAPQESTSALVQVAEIDESFLLRVARGLLALVVILSVLWAFSAHRKAIDWALVGKGLLLQLGFALLVLKTDAGRGFFLVVNDVFVALIGYTNAGARFVFGGLVDRVACGADPDRCRHFHRLRDPRFPRTEWHLDEEPRCREGIQHQVLCE